MKFIKSLNDFDIYYESSKGTYLAFHKYNSTFKSGNNLAKLEKELCNCQESLVK